MTDSSRATATLVRGSLLKVDPAWTLRALDTIDLGARAKVSPVVGVPLRQLQQRRDVASFAVTAPLAAVKALVEVLAIAPLERVITLLGDHATSPTFEQLETSIDELLATGGTVDDVVVVLTYAVAESFPAAAHCRRLFEERPELSLPVVPDAALPTVAGPLREVRPEVREQRRARREEERRRKKPASPTRPTRPPRAKTKGPTASQRVTPTQRTIAPHEERRPLMLTPLEVTRFDRSHSLVGTVVIAEVPFSEPDELAPDTTSKNRPVLVVAATDEELLVRGIFSNPSPTRQVFSPWRRLGLDHPSYVEDIRTAVANPGSSLHRLGVISVAEWNALS
jgi:hypothetical protein